MDLNHLRTFHLVAKFGTLSAAARALEVPTSTVSRHLSRLEDALGVDLVHRGARGVSVTEAGEALLERSRGPLEDLLELTDALPSVAPHGTLRITAPTHVALSGWFIELLERFRRAHEEVDVDVSFSSWMLDPIEHGFDVAFRPLYTLVEGQDLMVRKLASIPVGLFAARAYIERFGLPERPQDLELRHEMVAPRFLVGQELVLQRARERARVCPRVVAVGDDLSFVLAMMRCGAGYAAVPLPEARRVGDELVRVLPEWELPPLEPSMVWPRRRFMAPRLRAFVDFVAEEFLEHVRGEG
ncbi:MAG: LysR family transcriptional regulator [Myxococcota bacterium]